MIFYFYFETEFGRPCLDNSRSKNDVTLFLVIFLPRGKQKKTVAVLSFSEDQDSFVLFFRRFKVRYTHSHESAEKMYEELL